VAAIAAAAVASAVAFAFGASRGFVGVATAQLQQPPQWPRRVRQSLSVAAGAAATAEAAAPAAPAGLAGEEIGFWLDFRPSRMKMPAGSQLFRSGMTDEEMPEITAVIATLLRELKEKLKKIGIVPPGAREIVRAVIVEQSLAEKVSVGTKKLGIPLFVVKANINGTSLPWKASIVVEESSGIPVGALAPPPTRLTTLQPQTALEVSSLQPLDMAAVAAEKAKEEAELARYFEGLKDPEKYVSPPKSRLRWLLGGTSDEIQGETFAVGPGAVFAKTMPPDAIMWARALMQRRKEGGKGKPSYTVPSDRTSKATPIRDETGGVQGGVPDLGNLIAKL